jgi:hypothetical protein
LIRLLATVNELKTILKELLGAFNNLLCGFFDIGRAHLNILMDCKRKMMFWKGK